MARETSRAGKSETLTIRLDPKTRFVLEYVSRLKGQTITTVVERAILTAAEQETVTDYLMGGTLGWSDFWNISEGVRALSIAARREFYPTFEEDKRLSFCREHWPFFWASKEKRSFLNFYVDVLWPRIDEFIQIHDDKKANDYFAAGKAMQAALVAAQLKAPEWPIKEKNEEKKPSKGGGFSRDLDDDIPF
ncbi:hypothetical protein C5748_27000 [Phyllobacterium phragmitis]|uniref:Uncharacterized protein n=1 Tax=Phyllobacterium phragmitis TaxID=2670329 RepID=A0A2S9IIT1_9HYPH|nr:hypothetical protein [Phyllobacterium phragmitis]PRD40427.1 hypothetical protein C5748_27000 [Phyllobacterium phragmitis]